MSEGSLYASRVRVYPRRVHGIARDVKWAILAICLTIYYLLPWLRWDRGEGRPNQALLLDISHERFYIFGLTLWPQDIYLLTGALILGAVSLFLVTSLVGRAWCGYTCPQTVWTDLFMLVERRIEGDRNERMRRDAQPASFNKIWRKILKHGVWVAIAFWTGGAWIMYYVDAPTVTRQFWTGTASAQVYFFTALFTLSTYLLAGWAREQVCTYRCPWPRFQASMLDEQSFIVTYQAWRGEPRGHGRRDPDQAKLGDCVDCSACVNVCPTGVDIRNGVQLACIGCGLCVDACNEVMERTNQPKWLITWDTLARQKARAAGLPAPVRLLRPRTFIYLGALTLVVAGMVTALLTRQTLQLTVQHDRAPLFVMVKDGALRNGYTLSFVNKTQQERIWRVSVSGLQQASIAPVEDSADRAAAVTFTAAADHVTDMRVMVFGRPDKLVNGTQTVRFVLSDIKTGETMTQESMFMGPGAQSWQ